TRGAKEEPMRVMHVMEATIGGTRRHLRDVAAGQARAGLEVCVVAAAERAPAVRDDFEALRRAGVDVRELPMVRSIRPAVDRRHVRAIGDLLRELQPTIVHTHSSKAGALGRWASLRTGIGVRVHTPHTFAFLFDAMFSGPKRTLFRAVERQLGARTQATVAVSQGEAETIRASGVVPPDRVHVVENGIDPAPWEAAEPYRREELGLPEDAPCVLVVGLLNSAKGQDVAIRALGQPGCERLQLLLAGHGDDEPELRRLVGELGLTDRVQFLGWRDDVPRLVASADALCLPSRWEGMPYAVLEAMAAGKPVVATRVDGARDLVVEGETGYLCPIEAPDALGAALARLTALVPSERRALGAEGRRRFLAGYRIERMVERLDAVYAAVQDPPPSAAR
ncbi:MAG: glycosyltransferase family 4 protein, partial [Planctomycetota bacterium]